MRGDVNVRSVGLVIAGLACAAWPLLAGDSSSIVRVGADLFATSAVASPVAAVVFFGFSAFGLVSRRRTPLAGRDRQLFGRLWDATTDGAAIVDQAARVVGWNPAMEQLTGIPRRQALGRVVSDIWVFGGANYRECLHLALSGVEAVTSASSSGATVGGSQRAYCSPVRDPNGEISGAFLVVTSPVAVHARLTGHGGNMAIASDTAA